MAHFLLFRFIAAFLAPIDAEIDRYFDQAVKDARQKGWVQTLIDELEEFRRRWKREWMIEFGADMIAAYCAGPAYGWANVRLCSNVSAELFGGASTHPADAARTIGIDAMLRCIGYAKEATEIEAEWKELVGLVAQVKPQSFDLGYPQALLQSLAGITKVACEQVGLKAAGSGSAPVTELLHEAWKEFRARPGQYQSWEQTAIQKLKVAFGLP